MNAAAVPPPAGVTATFRFYEELNDFLPPARRKLGIELPPVVAVDTLKEALAAARKLRYPVRLALDLSGPALPPSRRAAG
jgi:hypothetical protein